MKLLKNTKSYYQAKDFFKQLLIFDKIKLFN